MSGFDLARVDPSRIALDVIEGSIDKYGWFSFGKKEFECPGLSVEIMDYYMRNDSLPSPCNTCYKALVFWERYYSGENVENFLRMLRSFEVNYRGKLNKGVVVFYFRDKGDMMKFVDNLRNKMAEFGVKGGTQWRRACKQFQDKKPHLWKNAKEFLPQP